MVEDNRVSSRPETGIAEVASGSSSNFVALDLRDEQTFVIEEVFVQMKFGGSTGGVIELYDEQESVQPGAETDRIDKFYVEAGDRVNPDMVYEDVEDGIIVTADGNQDAEVTVTVGGYMISG